MRLKVKDGSPDGMHVVYKTYVMTWDELKAFIDHMAKWENRVVPESATNQKEMP